MAAAAAPSGVYVAVLGIGLVGSAFLRQLAGVQSAQLAGIAPIALVHAQTSSRGTTSGFAPIKPPTVELSGSALSKDELISRLSALPGPRKLVVVDNTSSEDIASWYPALLQAGISVVTPNKKAFSGQLSLYKSILSAQAAAGTRALHESTVGAGLPVIQTLNDLVQTGDSVVRIEGVLSGTLSYIFNQFSPATASASADLPTFSSIVREAREKGYTEPHPADDLSGADVARKLTILSRLVPQLAEALPEGYRSVSITSLVPKELEGVATGDEFVQKLPQFDSYFAKLRDEAERENAVLRYVGVVDVEKKQIRAALEKYPKTHPFATALGGSDNILAFHTSRYAARPLLVQGAGAGADVTAMGVLADVLKIARV
ncbi:aspartate kinase homoserine dehydrogenase [Auriculariales sp. MPI-PUGE-AT-0066]|nr:aspartate kinase homoserine dehydrogenase [Auriculariales sp. MPI-PUGE-AT-0066]